MRKRSRRRRPPTHEPLKQTPARARWFDRDLYAILAIVALWVALMPLVNPTGDIPLCDDWCYGKAVFDLLRTHEYHMVGLVTMTLVAQVVWGALFCLLFGESFVVLRFSTLVLALGGLLATYGLLREARTPRWAAAFGCAVIALNPYYLSLSYGFMTDVPFVAVTMMAVYAYVKALRRESAAMIALGTSLACAGVLIRQIGIILPVGFALAYVVRYGLRAKTALRAILPAVIIASVLFGYLHRLESTHRLPSYFNYQAAYARMMVEAGPSGWAAALSEIAVHSYIYLGLSLLPFLLLTISHRTRGLKVAPKVVNLLICLSYAAVVASVLARKARWLPLAYVKGNYVMNFGIGPAALRDVWEIGIRNYPWMPVKFWIWVGISAIIGGAILLWSLLTAVEILARRGTGSLSAFEKAFLVLLLALVAMNLGTLVFATAYTCFDRYFLPAILLSMVLAGLTVGESVRVSRPRILGGLLSVLIIGYFSVCGTHDYMTWNRLRWKAADELMRARHVGPRQVDGGFEFNAWYNYDESKCAWDVGDDYVIAFGPAPGYYPVKRYTFRRWMPPGEGTIYVLVRSGYPVY